MTITRKQKWEGKQLYGRFKRLINNISHKKTWTWLRKGNFKRETESLLIAAQNNAIIGAFSTVTKGLLKGQEDLEVGDRVETIQTTALLKTARILRGVLET